MKQEINFDLKNQNTSNFVTKLSSLLNNNEIRAFKGDDDFNIHVNDNFINQYEDLLEKLV